MLVAALTRESKTTTVQRWLREQSTMALALSDWTITEFSAALSLKLRERQIGADDRADVLAEFTRCGRKLHTLSAVDPSVPDRGTLR